MTSHPEFIQAIRQFMDIAMHHSLHERLHFAKALGLSTVWIAPRGSSHPAADWVVQSLPELADTSIAHAF